MLKTRRFTLVDTTLTMLGINVASCFRKTLVFFRKLQAKLWPKERRNNKIIRDYSIIAKSIVLQALGF